MNNRRETVLVACLLFFSLALRFWGVGAAARYVGDESILIPASSTYLDTGKFSPDSWEHPPFKYFLLAGSMKLFGNNAYGWRIKNVLFGSLTVLVLYLLGKELFTGRRIAMTAALLLTVCPVHVMFSRTVYGEIPLTFFLLLAVHITVLYVKGKISSPLAAGICLGLALASKWYCLVLPPLLFITALAHAAHNRLLSWQRFLHLVFIYALLPAALYLAVFYPWFGRGYSLPEFAQMQLDAYNLLQNQPLEMFENVFFRATPSSPRAWFVKPLITGVQIARDGAWSRFLVFMSNPPFWLLTIPAVFFAAYRSWKARDWRPVFVILLFLSLYLQFFFVHRPIFLYSALVVLPFVYLLVAAFLIPLLDAFFPNASWPHGLLSTVICVWGMYLYPLVTNNFVPAVLYKPLFALGAVMMR